MSGSSPNRQPFYTQIAQELMRDIASGVFQPGAFIPTEPELCQRFAVSRVTVRGALRELEVRGLISRRRGIGTRVQDATTQTRFIHVGQTLDEVLAFTENLEFRLVTRRDLQASEDLAAKLETPVGRKLVRIESIRVPRGSDMPVCLSEHFISPDHAEAVERMDGRMGSLGRALAGALEEEIAEVEQTIDAVNLEKREAVLLHAKGRDAALSSLRRYRTASGKVILVSRSLFPKERSSYQMIARRTQQASAERQEDRLRA